MERSFCSTTFHHTMETSTLSIPFTAIPNLFATVFHPNPPGGVLCFAHLCPKVTILCPCTVTIVNHMCSHSHHSRHSPCTSRCHPTHPSRPSLRSHSHIHIHSHPCASQCHPSRPSRPPSQHRGGLEKRCGRRSRVWRRS